MVYNTAETILKSDKSTKETTNHLFGNDIVNCSLIHLKYLLFMTFKRDISIVKNEKLQGHLENLCSLCGLIFL